ncbi:MAG: tripartite tricarboxylate transporter family receptor [Marmoricola sp.]|nr:tripartite tricarboxylate transporter family receptor [Marmoricola sp.]
MRKVVIFMAAAVIPLAGCSATPSSGSGGRYPNHSITLAVQSSAGSGADVLGRAVAKLAQQDVGGRMVVETHKGGNGMNQLQFLAGRPADGYTLGTATRLLTVSLNGSKFSPSDFTWICQMETDPFVIAVNADSPYKTFDDLAKAATSGAQVTVGGSQANSVHSLFAAMVAHAAKIKLTYVPFDGGQDAITAHLGNHVAAIDTAEGAVLQYVASGQIRVLAVSSEKRTDKLPDVPTFNELGYPSVQLVDWRGLFARKGLPSSVVQKLGSGCKKMVESPEFKKYTDTAGTDATYLGGDDFSAEVRDQFAQARELAAQSSD